MWEITKEFNFEYGHRVWTQNLNPEFSLQVQCACRHLHGHSGKVLVTLESNQLENGMVTDFKHLQWFKKFLDDNLDHKFLIDYHDPIRESLLGGLRSVTDLSEINEFRIRTYLFDGYIPATDYEVELINSFVVLPFVPTSENLSKWLFDIVSNKMKEIEVKTKSVRLFETVKSQSLYVGD